MEKSYSTTYIQTHLAAYEITNSHLNVTNSNSKKSAKLATFQQPLPKTYYFATRNFSLEVSEWKAHN